MPFVIGVMEIGGVEEGKKALQNYFRQAQVAPPQLPEFQGNVVAVHTAPFWDDDLAALHQRMERLNDELDQQAEKDLRLTPAAKEQGSQKAISKSFTQAELECLNDGVSNRGHHYMGAAKILAPIGQAFVEDMGELRTPASK